MKIAVIIVRTLVGLLYFAFSIAFFFKLMPQPELSGPVQLFMVGMGASGYMFPIVKAIELICGIAFITGRFVPLATVVIFPITVNILLFHGFLAPEGLVVPIFLFAANLFLAYAYRKNYETLVVAK
jgi:putative oxidoreductase